MPRPRHSTVVAYLALFVALSGSAYAATQITSKQIKDNTIKSRDIRNKTIATKDLSAAARKALRGAKGAAGPAGQPGAPGAQGPQGPQGPAVTPARTVFVSAAGTPVENGAALRDALAALPAASKDEPRAVALGAGRYDLDGTGVAVPSHVALYGAGQTASIIDSSPSNVKLSVVKLGEFSGLRDLAVRTDSAVLGSTGVDETDGKGSVIENVEVDAGVGVVKRGGTIRDSNVEAFSTGVRALSGGGGVLILKLADTRVSAFGADTAQAVHASATIAVTDSQLSVFGQSTASGFLYDATSGVATVQGSLVSATAGTTARGISVDPVQGTPKVQVHASVVEALGLSNVALRASRGGIDAGATQLAASTTAAEVESGTVRCAASYTGTMATATC